MTTRLWNNGAIGLLSNPNDWSPAGPVLPGDLLVMQNGTGPQGSVAIVAGAALAGDTVYLAGNDPVGGSTWQPTLVAVDGARITAVITDEANGIDLTDIGNPPITHPGQAPAFGTVDVIGRDHVTVDVVGQRDVFDASGTVNLAPGARMIGGVEASNNGVLVMNGGAGASFVDQASSLGENGVATINAAMVGTGHFDMTYLSSLTLDGKVGAGQTINNDDGSLILGRPQDFHGLVNWTVDPLGGDFVLLAGLHAQSYAYAHDTFALFNGNNEVFSMRLDATGGAFVAVQTSGGVELASTGVSVPGTVLPLHHMA